MSVFELAIPVVLLHEGVMSQDKDDRGGSTHYGISLRFLKTLRELDEQGFMVGDFNEDGVINAQDIQELTRGDAIALYRQYWWAPHRYERINDQALATKTFDLTVNMGSVASHRCLQRAVRAVNGHCLVEDGLFGPKTLMAVNNVAAERLLAAYRSEAAGYYRSLHQSCFEKGWLNRAYA